MEARATLRFSFCAALGLVGCAPVAVFRPVSGFIPGANREFGIGGTVVTPRPYVTEDAHRVAQVWFSTVLTRVSDVSGIVAFDEQALAIGGSYRLRYLKTDRIAAGGELELGWAWAAISAPFALRVVDQSFVYVAPRLGTWGEDAIFGVPVGVSVRIYRGLMLRGEWQRSWQSFKYYNRRDAFGAAVAYQF
jgi:hypothetical protein